MSVQQSRNEDQRNQTYENVLQQIIAGRQATTAAAELDPETIALHDEVQITDIRQPGLIQRLLNR